MTRTPVEKHFDEVASKYDSYTKKRELHYSTLKKLLKGLIPEGKAVLEIGCGTGDLLASLNPKVGYGYDLSSEMIKRAKKKYGSRKNLLFSTQFPSLKSSILNHKSLDFIFMSDVVEHLEDPSEMFAKISKLMGPNTRFINTMMNPVWIPVETVYNFFGWKMPEGPHYRIKYQILKIKIEGAGMKIIEHDYKLLMPIKIPFVTNFMNKYLEKHLKRLSFIEYFVAVKV